MPTTMEHKTVSGNVTATSILLSCAGSCVYRKNGDQQLAATFFRRGLAASKARIVQCLRLYLDFYLSFRRPRRVAPVEVIDDEHRCRGQRARCRG
jgi:hypothetical protein